MSDPRPTSNEKSPLLGVSNINISNSPPSPSPSPSQHYITIEEDHEPMSTMNNDNYSFRTDDEMLINDDRIGSVRKGLSFAKLAKSIPDGDDSFPKEKDNEQQTFWQKVKIRFPYYVPVAGWLPNYNVKKSLFNDVIAGLAVSSLLIPQVNFFFFFKLLFYVDHYSS